jgi:DNA repair exonuclease SbcCD ATPase subunit
VITTRDEEIRRHDTIIMNMTEAMKALNPPAPEESSGARESPESPGPAGELGELREELDAERTRRELAESTLREGMAEEQRRREEAERERDDLRRELHAAREAPEASEAAEEQQGRGEPHPDAPGAQEGAERVRGGVGCSAADREVAMEREEAEARAARERIATMAEELRKAELVRDRLEALDRLMDSYPEGHDMRARLEALHVDRAIEGVNEYIRVLTDALLYPRGT